MDTVVSMTVAKYIYVEILLCRHLLIYNFHSMFSEALCCALLFCTSPHHARWSRSANLSCHSHTAQTRHGGQVAELNL